MIFVDTGTTYGELFFFKVRNMGGSKFMNFKYIEITEKRWMVAM